MPLAPAVPKGGLSGGWLKARAFNGNQERCSLFINGHKNAGKGAEGLV
jgi:hypothetical protein